MTTVRAGSGSAAAQGVWWAAGVADWAETQERQVTALYTDVLDRTRAGAGTRLLDIGCGAGLFCRLAADRGAAVTGLDASAPLLDIAARRVPDGTFTFGEMEAMPYPRAAFDVVTGMNSIHYAASPDRAMAEVARVAAAGASVAIATWGPREECAAAGSLDALAGLLPLPPDGEGSGPFSCSDKDVLAGLARRAGLVVEEIRDVACLWHYRDLDEAVRGLLAGGPSATRALRSAGRDRAAAAIGAAIAPHRSADGGYRLPNVFRCLIATARK